MPLTLEIPDDVLQTVSNTSPLTNLAVIGRLGLVREQFAEISIPTAVWSEMVDRTLALGSRVLRLRGGGA